MRTEQEIINLGAQALRNAKRELEIDNPDFGWMLVYLVDDEVREFLVKTAFSTEGEKMVQKIFEEVNK